MALVDVTKIVSVPGKIAINPTDFTAAYPHGGLALGAARNVLAIPRIRHAEVPLDPYGGEPGEVLYLGSSYRLVATFRGYDLDAVNTCFPNTLISPPGQPLGRTIEHPGTNRAGTLRSGSAVEVIFSPDDFNEHQGFLLYRAIPVIDPALAILLAAGTVLEFTCGFIGIRRASDGKVASVGLLEYLTP